MSLAKDPEFRSQYDVVPQADNEFEQALGGNAPSRRAVGVNPAIQIISPPDGQVWLPPLRPLK